MERIRITLEAEDHPDITEGQVDGYETISTTLNGWDPDQEAVMWEHILKRESDGLYFKMTTDEGYEEEEEEYELVQTFPEMETKIVYK